MATYFGHSNAPAEYALKEKEEEPVVTTRNRLRLVILGHFL